MKKSADQSAAKDAGKVVSKDAVKDPVKEAPKAVIRVTNAVYGLIGGKTCSATGFVAAQANGNRTATVSVGNGMYGDPDPAKPNH